MHRAGDKLYITFWYKACVPHTRAMWGNDNVSILTDFSTCRYLETAVIHRESISTFHLFVVRVNYR